MQVQMETPVEKKKTPRISINSIPESPVSDNGASSVFSQIGSVFKTISKPTIKTAEEEEESFVLAQLERHNNDIGLNYNQNQRKGAAEWFALQLHSSIQSVAKSFGSVELDSVEDWDYWGDIINDYDNQIRLHPRLFTRKLHHGIPTVIRGMMWQLMAGSKSETLEEQYIALLDENGLHDKVIRRDLARTFPGHEHFRETSGPGQTALFNILKAYSVYDPEIGYCQGLPFVVGPLILNMPEEQAFCLLVRMMLNYDFRNLYTPKMIGLQLRNYQFDKLIAEQIPLVWKHLQDQGIISSMYASQWFMTIFAYRFPLELVFRIFDIIFAQGSEAVLRFALALVKNNADKIVTLTFEPLLEFLKTGLFDLYISNPNKLVADAQTISISKAKLSQLEQEFKEKLRKESPDFIDAEHYKHQNKQLMAAIKNLEHGFNILSKETDSLKIELTQAIDENANLTDKIESLEEQVEALKGVLTSDKNHAMAEVREEMDELAQKNVFLTNKNCNLEDAVQELQALVTHNQLLLEKAMERERFSE